MKTIQLELFTFDELSDDAKQKAIKDDRNSDARDFYYDYTIEHYQHALKFVGFEDVDISFSGFHSQGDGASFTANYDSSLIDIEALKDNINNVQWGDNVDDKRINDAFNSIDEYLTGLKNSLCYLIYKALQDEYDHQNSDEYISDHLIANEYYFLENGTIYHEH